MKKFKTIGLGVLLAISTLAFPGQEEKKAEEMRGKELCAFATDFFSALSSQDQSKENVAIILSNYTKSDDPLIQKIASSLVNDLEDGNLDPIEVKEGAVTELGRLIKYSVEAAKTPYLLKKRDLSQETEKMAIQLKGDLPKGDVNYHKLMIESLADHRSDIALYAYLKIAEERSSE